MTEIVRTSTPSDSVPVAATFSRPERLPQAQPTSKSTAAPRPPIAILGVPFDNLTIAETMGLVEQMVTSRRPHYLVTANVDFLVQAAQDLELRRIIAEAHLVLCDGTPLLWASRWLGNALPERVAGSDLVPLLIALAAQKGYRIFFLGGSPESTTQAVTNLQRQYPNLVIAGRYAPPFQDLLQMDHEEMTSRIRAAKPDLLLVSFGCPKQEKWINMHYRSLQVPVSIGVGATIDFLAGRMARAPVWMQRTGTEWIFRLLQEPRRLGKRYAKDLWCFGWLLAAQWWQMQFRARNRSASARHGSVQAGQSFHEVHCPEWLDATAVEAEAQLWQGALADDQQHVLLHLEDVKFIDSTGVGLLIRLRKRIGLQGRHLVLIAPSPPVTRALQSMRLWSFFFTAADAAQARGLLKEIEAARPAVISPGAQPEAARLIWQGEITAANSEEVWKVTEAYLAAQTVAPGGLAIDLSAVTFIDSTGVGLMVRARKTAARAGVTLTFCNPQANVINVVRLSRLESFLLAGEDAENPAAQPNISR